VFAALSVLLLLLPIKEDYFLLPSGVHHTMGYYLNYDLASFLSFYLGTCFLGLFAWESANMIRKVSRFMLLLACIVLAIASFVLSIVIPVDSSYYGFILARAPFYLIVLVDVVLLWNLTMMNRQEKAPFKLFMIASFSLIGAIWLLIYAVPIPEFRADLYGMMVSFFILVVPAILAWEALLDNVLIRRGGASVYRIVDEKTDSQRIAVVVLISIIAGFFAIIQGSIMWMT